MKRSCYFILLIVLCMASSTSAASREQIEDAIAKAQAYLYTRQNEQGNWERVPKAVQPGEQGYHLYSAQAGNWGGTTAIVVYSLLASGQSPEDPRLKPAIDFLMTAELLGTYAVGLRAQALSLVPQTPEVRRMMQRDAAYLVRGIRRTEPGLGFYDYVPNARDQHYSLSRAQYAVLGVWIAQQHGAEVPAQYWQQVARAWQAAQDADGSWKYKATGYPPSLGITAPGVATMLIAQEMLQTDVGRCNGNPVNVPVDKGMQWITRNINRFATSERFERERPFANLFSVERIALASGLREIGGTDWYAKGVTFLLEQQRADGSWSSGAGGDWGMGDVCWGLLFLARGQAPVVISKLEHGTAAPNAPLDWQQRPRDIANLTRWASRAIERDLAWQIVNLDLPVEALLEAPVLYISGSRALTFNEEQKQKLKGYVEHGGLIVGHADCSSQAFTISFTRLMQELFPYQFRALETDHPIYAQQFSRSQWRRQPNVQGLSNGVRELALLIPTGDPGRGWQRAITTPGREEDWELGANIVQYAVDKVQFQPRGYSPLQIAAPATRPQQKLEVLRLELGDNWNPEPAGWRRFARVIAGHGIDLQTKSVVLADLPNAPAIVHWTGTTAITLDDAHKQAIRQFIEAGGTLIVDAAGGSEAFGTSVRRELAQLFEDQALRAVASNSPLLRLDDKPLDGVNYRTYARRRVGLTRDPQLELLAIDGRIAIVFSPIDISFALVGTSMDGVVGYTPQSGTDLMTAILQAVGKSE